MGLPEAERREAEQRALNHRQSSAAMYPQRWEYATCAVFQLDDMGAEGWEAYAVTETPPEPVCIYLKRKVAS